MKADMGGRHSSPLPPANSDHVAEIARLIGLVSAQTQSVHSGGSDASHALTELRDYLQQWPEAQATLEDQVKQCMEIWHEDMTWRYDMKQI